MTPMSLDPFRKTFKHQKTSFPATTSFQKFFRRCIIGCCVVLAQHSRYLSGGKATVCFDLCNGATGHHYCNAQALPAIQQRMFNPFRQTLVDGSLHQTLLTEKRDSMAIIQLRSNRKSVLMQQKGGINQTISNLHSKFFERRRVRFAEIIDECLQFERRRYCAPAGTNFQL